MVQVAQYPVCKHYMSCIFRFFLHRAQYGTRSGRGYHGGDRLRNHDLCYYAVLLRTNGTWSVISGLRYRLWQQRSYVQGKHVLKASRCIIRMFYPWCICGIYRVKAPWQGVIGAGYLLTTNSPHLSVIPVRIDTGIIPLLFPAMKYTA